MRLKVWGGTCDGTNRSIVVAPTKKRAVQLLQQVSIGVSRHYFDGWWLETANPAEVALMQSGEGVWTLEGHYGKDFRQVVTP